MLANVELNTSKSIDVNQVLNMSNNYLQETVIKISMKCSLKSYNPL